MSPQTNSETFHRYSVYYHDPIPRAISEGLITESDAKLIKTYVYEHAANSGSKEIVSKMIIGVLVIARRWSGEYSDATISDLYKIVDGVKNDLSRRGKPYSQQTQRRYINTSKRFFIWLSENEICNIPIRKIEAISPPHNFTGIKSANSLLTPDEVLQIIKYARTTRNRAFFSMLYEGGFRVGEVATMKWGDISIDSAGVVVNVVYKTMKPRYLRLVICREALLKWKSEYPEAITDDSYIFLSSRGDVMKYPAVVRMLQRILKRARIDKRVNLHLFRHSRITHLIQEGVSESIIKMMMWGSASARGFQTYAHLSGNDIDKEMLRFYGIDESQREAPLSKLEPQICPTCNSICGPTSRYCSVCGKLLDDSDIKDADDLKTWLMSHKDLLTEFLNNSAA